MPFLTILLLLWLLRVGLRLGGGGRHLLMEYGLLRLLLLRLLGRLLLRLLLLLLLRLLLLLLLLCSLFPGIFPCCCLGDMTAK